MELRQYITILWKEKWLLILAPLAAAVLTYAMNKHMTPVYEAKTTLIVGQSTQVTQLNSEDVLTSERLARTYAEMARLQPVMHSVVDTLNLSVTWEELKKRVTTIPARDSQLLRITVEANSQEEARVIADEIARQLIAQSPTTLLQQEAQGNRYFAEQRLESLQTKIEAGQQRLEVLEAAMNNTLSTEQVQQLQIEINDLENLISNWENNFTQLLVFTESERSPNYLAVVEPAQADPDPVSPRVLVNTILAGMAALLATLGIIFLREYLDDTLKTSEDVEQILGLNVLGAINSMGGKDYRGRLVSTQSVFSPAAESYRVLRSSIRFMSVDHPIKSIIISSCNPGEGKSTTVANLAVVMAQAGHKVIVIDADLRRPMQHKIFQVPNLGGLTEWLCSPELELKDQLRQTEIENLRILTSGSLPPNPSELLGTERMGQLLGYMKDQADIVICDTPPVLPVTDASVLSNQVDGVMLVIHAGRPRREVAMKAIANLKQAKANLLGVVLNQVSEKKKDYYQGYYSTNRTAATEQLSHDTIKPRLWSWLSSKVTQAVRFPRLPKREKTYQD